MLYSVRTKRAATAIEYGLLAAGICLVIFAALARSGANLNAVFADIDASLVAIKAETYAWAGGAWTLQPNWPAGSAYANAAGQAGFEINNGAVGATVLPVGTATITVPAGVTFDYFQGGANTIGTATASFVPTLQSFCSTEGGTFASISGYPNCILPARLGLSYTTTKTQLDLP